jgi:hypothetical protein
MSPTHPVTLVVGAASFLAFAPMLLAPGLTSCDSPRKKECDSFLSAMKPLDEGMPTADLVDRVQSSVDAMQFQDQPLGVYAKNYKSTLTVLSNTIKLKASPSPPDGTDDVIKARLKEARTDREDAARYCAQ